MRFRSPRLRCRPRSAAATPMMTISATSLTGLEGDQADAGRPRTHSSTRFVHDSSRPRSLSRTGSSFSVVKAADEPKLVKPRSKALPMLVLLGGLIATAAVAFTRDNAARARAGSGARRQRRPATNPSTRRRCSPTPVRRSGPSPARTQRPRVRKPARRSASTRGRSTLGSVPRPDSAHGAPTSATCPDELPSRVVGR